MILTLKQRLMLTLRRFRLFLWAVLGLALVVLPMLTMPKLGVAQPAQPLPIAQTSGRSVTPGTANTADTTWRTIYQALPTLPFENHYISRATGEVATDNTLVGRIVQYHVNIRRRSPLFRLDWKLTLADYLGVNEWIDTGTYPGATTLNENPLEGDRQAIVDLSRAQRDELVEVLVLLFNPSYISNLQATPIHDLSSPTSSTPSTPTAPPPSSLPPLPQPGDAQLLAP
ncbi:MAG: hypothetical protein EA367_02055 [Leptolyngbya sp. DLM2.Bin15]|nr:MAG: hypothetical protein EA367_02055 [Leptolyngbya sp. DLM2.Bin15]